MTDIHHSAVAFPGTQQGGGGTRILRFLYTKNPFYLLSVLFVVHATSRWIPDSPGPYNVWPLIGLSFAYTLMMAITAFAIVRFGRVWDDARSILLILVGLFVELSLTFDDPLARNLRVGGPALLAGYLFTVLVAEGLLLGLRIRLPILFRLPFHCMLALLMLYPLLVVRTPDREAVLDVSWGIYLFSPVAALVLLTLLPAIRRGPDYVRDNGTPWSWPWFPWALFGVLVSGLCLRGYVLGLSFDPVLSLRRAEAMQFQTAYGTYFLFPILLSIAVLILETGLVSSRENVQRIALGIPLLCIVLSFPAPVQSVPYAEFLDRFLQRIASPVFVSVVAASIFYAIAFLRRVRFAEESLAMSLMVASIVGTKTVGFETLTSPSPILWSILCVFQIWRGLRMACSKRVLVGTIAGIMALQAGVLASGSEFAQFFVLAQMLILAILLLGMVFNDEFARMLRHVAAILLFVACVGALAAPIDLPHGAPRWSVAACVTLLIATSFAGAYVRRSLSLFCFGLLSIAACVLALSWRSYLYLRVLPDWPGIRSFAIAFSLLALAAAVSAAKAGLVQRLRFLIPSSNSIHDP